MKNLITLFLLVPFLLFSQTPQTVHGELTATKGIILAYYNDINTYINPVEGAFAYDAATKNFYVFDGTNWVNSTDLTNVDFSALTTAQCTDILNCLDFTSLTAQQVSDLENQLSGINTDAQTGSWNDATNEITLTGGNTFSITGFLETEVDADVSNEIQTFDIAQLNGTNLELSLSNDGVPTEVIDLSSLSLTETQGLQDVITQDNILTQDNLVDQGTTELAITRTGSTGTPGFISTSDFGGSGFDYIGLTKNVGTENFIQGILDPGFNIIQSGYSNTATNLQVSSAINSSSFSASYSDNANTIISGLTLDANNVSLNHTDTPNGASANLIMSDASNNLSYTNTAANTSSAHLLNATRNLLTFTNPSGHIFHA